MTIRDNSPDERSEPLVNAAEVAFIAIFVVIVGAVLIDYGSEIWELVSGLVSLSATGLVIFLLLGAGTLAFVVLPLLDPTGDLPQVTIHDDAPTLLGTPRQNRALEILAAEKLRLLRAIRDMDFDYDMGKLTDDLYVTQRVTLIRRTIAVMQRSAEIENTIGDQVDQVEAALAAFRGQT